VPTRGDRPPRGLPSSRVLKEMLGTGCKNPVAGIRDA
jgi:hypothetical protein